MQQSKSSIENTVAYKSRNLFRIWIRKQFSKVFKFISYRLQAKHANAKVLVVSSSRNKAEAAELLNKVAWGLPYSERLTIDFSATNEKVSPDSLPVSQRDYMKALPSHINFIINKKVNLRNYDRLLIDNYRKFFNPRYLLNFRKIDIVDKNFYSEVESAFWQNGFDSIFSKSELAKTIELSAENFLSLSQKHTDTKFSYCFVSGPSFDQYGDFLYKPGSLKVVCNSIVKNDKFLEHINGPDIVTFADPVFHFSSCQYAAIFRDHLLSVVEKYNPAVIVPLPTVPLLAAHYPHLRNNLIGMDHLAALNFPTTGAMASKPSGNILTQYMLPVASTLSDVVYIIGADGRKKDEKYFWKHSKSAQFDDEVMKTAFEAHPSFFRDRVYADYYDNHCQFLEELIRFGEEKGKRYVSLTNSHIPALSSRHAAD